MAILNLCQVLFYKWFSGKMEFVPDGVLGGYCRGTEVDRSTWRVLPMSGGGHVRLTTDLFYVGVPPFLEILLTTSKNLL
jgi:hypothetical protein